MALKPDATIECLESSYDDEIKAVVVECWDREDHNVDFATDDPDLLREWASMLRLSAVALESAIAEDEPRICGTCNGSGESPFAPPGMGRCPKCHGRG